MVQAMTLTFSSALHRSQRRPERTRPANWVNNLIHICVFLIHFNSYRWEQAAFQTVSFSVPDNWKSGRIWGRRNCDFSTNPGPNSCATGGCNGGLLCDPHTGTVSAHP